MIRSRDLDRVRVKGTDGKQVDYAQGVEEACAMLDSLNESTPDWVKVEAFTSRARPGKRAIEDQSFHAMFKGQGKLESVGASEYSSAGPTWREYMELRIEGVRREMEDKQSDTVLAVVDKLSPLINVAVGAIGRWMAGGAAPAVVPPVPAGQPVSGPDSELRDLLQKVAVMYRRDAAKVRQFEPFLDQMIAETQPSSDGAQA